jgi:hypothetical protein
MLRNLLHPTHTFYYPLDEYSIVVESLAFSALDGNSDMGSFTTVWFPHGVSSSLPLVVFLLFTRKLSDSYGFHDSQRHDHDPALFASSTPGVIKNTF